MLGELGVVSHLESVLEGFLETGDISSVCFVSSRVHVVESSKIGLLPEGEVTNLSTKLWSMGIKGDP